VVWLAFAAIVATAAAARPTTVGGVLSIAVAGAAATTVAMTIVYALGRRPRHPEVPPPAPTP
jgi:hypothetical protein